METFAYFFATLLLLAVLAAAASIVCLKITGLRKVWTPVAVGSALASCCVAGFVLIFVGVDSPIWAFLVLAPAIACCAVALWAVLERPSR